MRWIERARARARRALGPFGRGFLSGAAAVPVVSALVLYFFSRFSGDPSADLFRDLLQADLALLIAFSVATAGASIAVNDLERHLGWLGTSCSLGAAGAIAVGLNIALAAHVEAGNAGPLASMGLAWAIASTMFLAVLIALLPWATFLWSRNATED